MAQRRKNFTKEVKEEALRRLDLGASVAEVARACEVNPNVLHRWRREAREHGARAFSGNGKSRAEESQVAELERKVGRQALEIDFLRRCLQHVEEQRKLQALDTRNSSTRTWRKK
jgi:transposase